MLIFYTVANAAGEDDSHPNAFQLPHGDDDPVTLSDIQQAFPLGQKYHFTFQTTKPRAMGGGNMFVDILNPLQNVPKFGSRIVLSAVPVGKEIRARANLLHLTLISLLPLCLHT